MNEQVWHPGGGSGKKDPEPNPALARPCPARDPDEGRHRRTFITSKPFT